MSGPSEITARLRQIVPVLQRDYGVAELSFFGSQARGDARSESDLDVLVKFRADARVTLFSLARLARFLERELGRRVDLQEDFEGLAPGFRHEIEKDRLRVA